MFIIERLIGVGTYASLLFIICLFISQSSFKTKNILMAYTIALAVMGYMYEPYISADLYRIINSMKYYATFEFSSFWQSYVINSSTPSARILYWLIGKSGVYHIVSSISVIVSYGMIFYIVTATEKKFKISRSNVAITVFLLMTTSIYISVIGGIRMMLGISMILYCFYKESVEHKFRWYHIPLYIIAVTTHNMSVVLVGVRLVVALLDYKRKIFTLIFYFLFVFAIVVVMALNFNIITIGTLDKALGYIYGISYSYFWEYVIGVFVGIGILLLYWAFSKHKNDERYSCLKTYNTYMIASLVIAVIFMNVFSIFYRFIGHVTVVAALPMIMVTLESSHEGGRETGKIFSLQGIVLTYGFIIMAISCIRGSLCSLKFFVL